MKNYDVNSTVSTSGLNTKLGTQMTPHGELNLGVILRGLETKLQTTLVEVGVGTGCHVPQNVWMCPSPVYVHVALEETLQNQLRQFHTAYLVNRAGNNVCDIRSTCHDDLTKCNAGSYQTIEFASHSLNRFMS